MTQNARSHIKASHNPATEKEEYKKLANKLMSQKLYMEASSPDAGEGRSGEQPERRVRFKIESAKKRIPPKNDDEEDEDDDEEADEIDANDSGELESASNPYEEGNGEIPEDEDNDSGERQQVVNLEFANENNPYGEDYGQEETQEERQIGSLEGDDNDDVDQRQEGDANTSFDVNEKNDIETTENETASNEKENQNVWYPTSLPPEKVETVENDEIWFTTRSADVDTNSNLEEPDVKLQESPPDSSVTPENADRESKTTNGNDEERVVESSKVVSDKVGKGVEKGKADAVAAKKKVAKSRHISAGKNARPKELAKIDSKKTTSVLTETAVQKHRELTKLESRASIARSSMSERAASDWENSSDKFSVKSNKKKKSRSKSRDKAAAAAAAVVKSPSRNGVLPPIVLTPGSNKIHDKEKTPTRTAPSVAATSAHKTKRKTKKSSKKRKERSEERKSSASLASSESSGAGI